MDVLQRVDSEHSIRPLRWSIAHLTDASDETIQAMSELGVGWLVQDGFFFTGSRWVMQHGLRAAQTIPKLNLAREKGVVIGAGTDAHRVMSYNPFLALQWLLDGKTVDGLALGDPAQRPSRAEALELYTKGSAWFSFEDHERGEIKPGYLADAVVLDQDFFSVPLDQISNIRPLMTLINGKIAFRRNL
jgi:predicted amidohydrolase YtcJ